MPTIKAKKLRVRRSKESPWKDVPAVALKGNDGISPTLKVTQDGNNVIIEAVDKDGQTSATVIGGTGESGSGGGGSGGVSFTPGNALELTADGKLNVLTADKAEVDNTLPITSAAVATTVGNIEILLATI